MGLLRLIGGVLAALFATVAALGLLALELVGLSTAPDDFALLLERLPKVMAWLLTTPAIVPTLILVAVAVGGAYLIWSGTRKTTSAEIDRHPGLSESQIVALIEQHQAELPAPDDETEDLKKRFADLSHQVDKLHGITGALFRAKRAEIRIEKLAYIQNIFDKEFKLEDPRSVMRPVAMDNPNSLFRDISTVEERAELTEIQQRETQRIMSDAYYAVLTADEEQRFKDGKAKQNYHATRASLNAFREFLNVLQDRDRSQVSRLQKLKL